MYSNIKHNRPYAGYVLIAMWGIALMAVPATSGRSQDVVLKGFYEAALDIPRINYQIKRLPTDPPLGKTEDADSAVTDFAFLDTGASGIVMSKETAERMRLQIEAQARYADIGVGGTELFRVTEPVYTCLIAYGTAGGSAGGLCRGPGRISVKSANAGLLGEPLDIMGMPVMINRIVILHTGATNNMEYCAADIKDQYDAKVPKPDVTVGLRFMDFTNPQDAANVPPLPVMATNPVIDNVRIARGDKQASGTFLLDTGATISFISTAMAAKLGLVDDKGAPAVAPQFSLPIGGIGQMVTIPGFQLTSLAVPTRAGNALVFDQARVGVHDIKYYDTRQGRTVTLDGVFGSNFLCSSAKMEGMLPSEMSQTAFEYVILDFQKGIAGFVLTQNAKKTPAKALPLAIDSLLGNENPAK